MKHFPQLLPATSRTSLDRIALSKSTRASGTERSVNPSLILMTPCVHGLFARVSRSIFTQCRGSHGRYSQSSVRNAQKRGTTVMWITKNTSYLQVYRRTQDSPAPILGMVHKERSVCIGYTGHGRHRRREFKSARVDCGESRRERGNHRHTGYYSNGSEFFHGLG